MRKKATITEIDIRKAIEIATAYRGANISYLPRKEQENLIKRRYGDFVRGKPISRMRDEQVYSVAQSVYERSLRIVNQVKERMLEQRVRAS